jgi:cytosine/adenosine deaminase-related metal-dependent hydrolase
MKTRQVKNVKGIFFIFLMLAVFSAAAVLQPGDIAVIGINCDDPDTVAFVALADLPEGEVIRFTDSGWKSDNTFRANEGGVAYTVPSGGLAKGTVVSKDNPFTSAGWGVDNSGLGSGGFLLSSSGDQILAFQGDASSPTFIYALNDKGAGVWQSDATDSNTSALPSGLVDGTTAVALNEADNAKYTGITSGNRAELLAAVSDRNNWTGDNANRQTIDTTPWTVTGGAGDDPNISMASSVEFGKVQPGSVTTQALQVVNTGPSNDLVISAFTPVSGDTAVFSVGALPSAISPGGGLANIDIIYAPGFITGAVHSAVFNLLCNDPSDPTNAVTFSGMTEFGALSISNIQYTTNPSGDSPYNGQEVTTRGICTVAYRTTPYNYYVLSEPEGDAWNAVLVFDFNHMPEIGDEVQITGTVDEYYNMTEIKDITSYQVLSRSNTVSETVIPCTDLEQEKYEAVLVRVNTVTVSDENIGGYQYEWEVQDAGGTCPVQDLIPYRYIWRLGASLDAIRGVVWDYQNYYALQPRNDDDFIGRDVMHYALKGLVITPDGPKSNWFVEILDDDIVTVTNIQPAGVATVVDTQGIIFPGLIDAHNHPSWNSFPTLQFNNFPFGHRDEWGEGEQEYDDWKLKRSQVRNYSSVNDSSKSTISKFAEILELMAGCITIQGNYDGREYAHPDVMLFNIEQHPARMVTDIFAWEMSSSERQWLKDEIAGGAVNAVLIHLSEGPDATSLNQFYTWYNWGMLDETTAIIHGVPYGSNELVKIAAAGAKILWSPMSNMKLYEATLNIKLAKELGVKVGLSPDWTPSGCYNMLEELGYAWYLNETMYDSAYTPKEMCDMVTIVNAEACGLDWRFGRISRGYSAGFCVIDGDWNDPYMSLINARPKDVKLTIIDGMPRYGDPSLVQQLGVTGEYVNVWGRQKMMNIAFDHPFLDWSQETYAEITSHLRDAHNTLNTSCTSGFLDSEELQFLDAHLLQKGPDNIVPFTGDSPVVHPVGTVEYVSGIETNMIFNWKLFWDNVTASRELVHRHIAIVRIDDPGSVKQVIATNLLNDEPNQDVVFTPSFVDSINEYTFRFVTEDTEGNLRTNTFDDIRITVTPEPAAGIFALACCLLMIRRRFQ